MEMAIHQPSLSPGTFVMPTPRTFLSAKEGLGLLEKKQIVPLDPKIGHFNSSWKTATLVVFVVSLIIGFTTFVGVTKSTFGIDHSKESIDIRMMRKVFSEENLSEFFSDEYLKILEMSTSFSLDRLFHF